MSDEVQHPAGLYVARQRELVDLMLLGLLCERPRHIYDVHRELRQRGNTSFLRGLPRSLYHGMDRLLRDGFVQEEATTRDGARPERTVYDISEDGRREFQARLQELLRRPSDGPTFFAALTLLPHLTPADAVWALRTRAAAVAGEARNIEARLEGALQLLPRLALVELEFLRDQLQSEHRWIESILADIDSGELTWPDWSAYSPPGISD